MEIVGSFVWPGADAKDLRALEKALDGRAPELVEFYRKSDGLELCLEPGDWAAGRLEGVDKVVFDDCWSVLESLAHNAEHFPGALVFGGDGGSMLLALDLRKPGLPSLLLFPMDEEPYLDAGTVIAGSLKEFLERGEVRVAIQEADLVDWKRHAE